MFKFELFHNIGKLISWFWLFLSSNKVSIFAGSDSNKSAGELLASTGLMRQWLSGKIILNVTENRGFNSPTHHRWAAVSPNGEKTRSLAWLIGLLLNSER